MGFVLGDMGRHEEAREATRRAIQLNPTLSRAQANLVDRPAAARRDERARRRRAERASTQMEVHAEGQLAHFNLGLAFRQKGYYAEALREYALALERGEDATSCCRRWPRCTCCDASRRPRVELYDELLDAAARQPEAVERARRRAAPGRAASPTRRRATGARSQAEPRLRARAQQPRRRALSSRRRRRGGRRVPRRARRAADVRQGAAQPRAAAQQGKAASSSRSRRTARCCSVEPEHPVAWNGVGLVLAELRKFEDARNAFARAIQARPDYAEAHYNLSFTLSNLGDFEGALRETKRALELDPYYVAQKFELAIDLEYEDPDLSIQPDLGARAAHRRERRGLRVRPGGARLAVHRARAGDAGADAGAAPATAAGRRTRWRRTTSSKGLLRSRRRRGEPRARARRRRASTGYTLLGDIFARQGLYGEALERYREARARRPEHARGRAIGEATRAARAGSRRARRGRSPRRCCSAAPATSRC